MAVESKPNTSSSYHIDYLLSLSRHKFRLTKSIAKSKVELVNLIVQVFPEFPQYFSSIYGKTPFSILSKANSLDSIVNISYSRFESLCSLSRGKFTFAKLSKLKTSANLLLALRLISFGFSFTMLLKELLFLKRKKILSLILFPFSNPY
jgi:hypothetical protein